MTERHQVEFPDTRLHNHQRLTWPERELIKQLGAKLYGRRIEVGGSHG